MVCQHLDNVIDGVGDVPALVFDGASDLDKAAHRALTDAHCHAQRAQSHSIFLNSSPISSFLS